MAKEFKEHSVAEFFKKAFERAGLTPQVTTVQSDDGRMVMPTGSDEKNKRQASATAMLGKDGKVMVSVQFSEKP